MTPVRPAERIACIDSVRGMAVLGILLLNIVSMGLPFAYWDPTPAGGADGPNLAVWAVMQALVEGKMRAIFSMLFGAGLILMTNRAEVQGRGGDSADVYLRRSLWLMAFGVVHAYLIWDGDILFYYGAVGLGLFVFRKLRPRTMFVIAAVVLFIAVPRNLYEALERQDLRDAAKAADRAAARGEKLTASQTEAQKKWQEKLKDYKPGPDKVKEAIDKHHSSWLRIFQERAGTVVMLHTNFFYFFALWDVLSMMLIGMALIKLGYLSGDYPARAYILAGAVTLLLGLALNVTVVWIRIATWFDPVVEAWQMLAYDLCRLSLALAYISAVVLLAKRGWLRALAPVGRMALTNYLLASLLATLVFEGYGLGLYGRLERYQLYYVVAGIWAVQLIGSPLWLSRFRYGPMEWVWRSLTYWKRQPIRLEPVEEQAAALG